MEEEAKMFFQGYESTSRSGLEAQLQEDISKIQKENNDLSHNRNQVWLSCKSIENKYTNTNTKV